MSKAEGTIQTDSRNTPTSMEEINVTMISHARQIARKIGASAVLVYVDVIKSREHLTSLLKERRCILAARPQGGN